MVLLTLSKQNIFSSFLCVTLYKNQEYIHVYVLDFQNLLASKREVQNYRATNEKIQEFLLVRKFPSMILIKVVQLLCPLFHSGLRDFCAVLAENVAWKPTILGVLCPTSVTRNVERSHVPCNIVSNYFVGIGFFSKLGTGSMLVTGDMLFISMIYLLLNVW